MRITIFAAAVSACLISAGSALAADPAPQQSAAEIAAALAAKPTSAPAEAAAPASSDHVCPPGKVWADDGDGGGCDPIKEGTAGFNLGAAHHAAQQPAMATSRAAPAKRPTKVASLGSDMRSSAVHKDLLITFVTGSADLTPQARSNAREFAVALRDPRLKGKRFEIAGHTDASGGAEANQALSQRRADAVKAFIVAQGADASLLDAKGYGSQDLAVPQDPKAAGNRRVEARLLN
jgi:outer membrane protein OmpA-like peptidoglycan-associated protein